VQCSRCSSVVADTVTVCPRCGNPLLGAVDSYGATSFAPVLPAPQPVAPVAVKNATAPMQDMGLASTMMAGSSPVPPTMISGGGAGAGGAMPSPRYVVTPAPVPSPSPARAPYQAAPPPTMQSVPMAPQPQQSSPMAPMSPMSPMSPYGPPAAPLAPIYPPPSYPMQMPLQMPLQAQGTPGLAVAALICGMLGWIPFWIGFILCLLAITFGGIVLAQTRPGQPGRGLAITGLVFGLVLLLPAACGL